MNLKPGNRERVNVPSRLCIPVVIDIEHFGFPISVRKANGLSHTSTRPQLCISTTLIGNREFFKMPFYFACVNWV